MRMRREPSARTGTVASRPQLRSPGMGLLDGKNIVVTGVLTDASLAFAVARLAQEEGAEIVLTGAGRALSLTQRTARKLAGDVDGVRARRHRARAPRRRSATRWRETWGRVDGVLHAIGFAPAGRASATTSWPPSGTTSPSPCTSRRTR